MLLQTHGSNGQTLPILAICHLFSSFASHHFYLITVVKQQIPIA